MDHRVSREEWKAIYHAYLQSADWKVKRLQVLKRDGFKCRVCGSEENLHVHHFTYKNLFNEELEDLITLCARHHEVIHKV